MPLRPDRTILITDSLCGSSCAMFAKKLIAHKNVYAIGFGGAPGSEDAFDVGSFTGGNVNKFSDYEQSV